MARFVLSAFADEAGSTLEEQITALKENGIDYIEPRNINKKGILTFSDSELSEIKKDYDEVSASLEEHLRTDSYVKHLIGLDVSFHDLFSMRYINAVIGRMPAESQQKLEKELLHGKYLKILQMKHNAPQIHLQQTFKNLPHPFTETQLQVNGSETLVFLVNLRFFTREKKLTILEISYLNTHITTNANTTFQKCTNGWKL